MSSLIKNVQKGLWVPRHLRNAYTRDGTPELGSGQKIVTANDLAKEMEDPKFREAVELMGRYEGHTKAIQVVLHSNDEIAKSHETENEVAVAAYKRKEEGALEDSKTLAAAGVDEKTALKLGAIKGNLECV